MLYRQRRVAEGHSTLREVSLLDGERVEEQFVPENGLVSDSSGKHQLLVLTNQRVISFVNSDGHRETCLAPLKELIWVSVRANKRGFRDLIQGVALVLLGILAYFILGYVLNGITVASALGAAIVFVGMLFIARHLFWEEEGHIAFRGGGWEVSFPYKNIRAGADAYKLIDRFFELKMNINTYRSRLRDETGVDPPAPPFSPPPVDPPYGD